MNIEYLKNNGTEIAVVSSDEYVIVDTQSALDLVMTVKYETGATKLVISKSAICEDFYSQHGNCRRNPPKICQLSCEGCHLWRLLPLYQ